ncbi:MAG: DUF1003 domain-containing protein [Polyangiaceae bacterium]
MTDPPAPSERAPRHPHCAACARPLRRGEGRSLRALRPGIAAHLQAETNRALSEGDRVCNTCFGRLRTRYMLERLEADRGALSALESEIARKAAEHSTIAEDLVTQFERRATRGERVADAVARVGGSWRFVIGFFLFLIGWMAVNVVVLRGRPFDPYPFILLNLALSCLAAIQAPIIMMSQNRASVRDRMPRRTRTSA